METTIDLSSLFRKIRKNWKLLLILAAAGGILFNLVGLKRTKNQIDAAYASHKKYEQAADTLPGYFNETLFRLRQNLSENDAVFCEAYARIYRDYISEYLNGTLTEDSTRLESYMVFMDSYKDVLSVFSGAQRSYYDALISTDMDSSTMGATVDSYEKAEPSRIQAKWIVIGVVLGVVAGCVIVTLPYLMTDKLRTAQDMEFSFGVPVLATVNKSGAAASQISFISAGIALLLNNRKTKTILLASAGSSKAKAILKEIEEKLEERGIVISESELLSENTSDLEILNNAENVILVEETGASRYSDIQREIGRCTRYDTTVLGCIVTE